MADIQVSGECLTENLITPTQVSSGNCVSAGCSPQQSLPQPINGIIVSPDNVEWTPTSSASCMQAIGLSNLTDWLTWVEQNIITSYCSVKSASCQIGVSEVAADGSVAVVGKSVGAAIADCLGLSDENPHVLFDATTGTAIAGKIDTPTPDCATFNNLITTCPGLAGEGSIPNWFIGYTQYGDNPTLYARRFQTTYESPSRYFGRIDINNNDNYHTGIAYNTRINAQGMTTVYNDQGTDTNNPGSAVSYLVNTQGYYKVSSSLMLNTVYTTRSGKIVTWMLGLLVNRADGSSEEFRLDEKPLYLDVAAADGQDVTLTGSIGLYLNSGDSVILRYWYNDTTQSGLGHTVNVWANKSATTHFSVIRQVEQSVVISG